MLSSDLKNRIDEQINAIFKDNPLGEIQNNVKAMVTAIFSKLDLVTREEFDVQQKVLQATRKKLEELEQLVDKLSSPK